MRYTGYKYRIYPTAEQKVLMEKTFGCVRYIYNRGLAFKTALYQAEKKGISVFSLMKEMAKLKNDEATAWLKEVNSQALQASLVNLDAAYTRFFREKKGFPKFKAKNHSAFSFSNTQNTQVDWVADKISFPKFKEGVKAVLHRRFNGKIKTSTVSRTATGKYFISVLVEESVENPVLPTPDETRTLGLDLGIKNFLTDSEGNTVANPKHLSKKLKALRRQQRKLSRKKAGSNNRNKQRIRVARLHEKVANSRKDFLHKVTHQLAKNQSYACFDSLAIEDLDVAKMLRNGKKTKLSRHIADASWGMFRQFLTYKCERYGKNLLVIGRFEPSSKLCPCGYLNNGLTLKDREWDCPSCKTHHNRDVLAAKNIKHFAFCSQNTNKDKISVGQELPKPASRKRNKKPLEFPARETLKKETSMALAKM